MRNLVIVNNTIQVGSTCYPVIEVDTCFLSNSAKGKKVKKIENDRGVYIFVSDKDIFKFNIGFFNKEFTGVFYANNQLSIKTIEVPPYNHEPPKKDCVFYVGHADKLSDRLNQHWNHDRINGCKSLKLGSLSRKWIKPFLRVYVIYAKGTSIDNKTLEREIRKEYGASFGK